MALYDTANNFFLSEDELVNTPSRRDGVDEETEYKTRLRACDLAVQGLALLKCSQSVLCSAQVFIHRFYCKCSIKDHDVTYVAMAAAWLASKIEEACIRLKELIPVFHRLLGRRQQGKKLTALDPCSDDYFKIKGKLLLMEKELLKSFGFILHTGHPHRFLLTYLDRLKLHNLMQLAWNIVNDSFRTTLCVRFTSEVVACGAIFMAARKKKVPLPENPPWYELFGAKQWELYEVCRVMVDLYSRPGEDFCPAPPAPPQIEMSPQNTPDIAHQTVAHEQVELTSKSSSVSNHDSGTPAQATNPQANREPETSTDRKEKADNDAEKSRKRDRDGGKDYDDDRRSSKKYRREKDREKDRYADRYGYRSRSTSRDGGRRKDKHKEREHRRSSKHGSRHHKHRSYRR